MYAAGGRNRDHVRHGRWSCFQVTSDIARSFWSWCVPVDQIGISPIVGRRSLNVVRGSLNVVHGSVHVAHTFKSIHSVNCVGFIDSSPFVRSNSYKGHRLVGAGSRQGLPRARPCTTSWTPGAPTVGPEGRETQYRIQMYVGLRCMHVCVCAVPMLCRVRGVPVCCHWP